MSRPPLTQEQIASILSKITFMDRQFLLTDKGDGFLLQVAYLEEDVEKPGTSPVLQKARKYYISPWMSTSEIVETAFLAVRRSMEHVVCEHFLYDGHRVYSPHFDIEGRIKLCQEAAFDKRVDDRK